MANLPQLKTNLFRFIPAIAWFSLSLWLLTLPGYDIPHAEWFDTLQVDKWVHVTLFFVLCFLFMLPLKKMGITHRKKMNWTIFITISAIAYGIAIEFVQRDFVPNRSFDIWDIAADSVGCLIAFFWWRKRWVCRKKIGPDRNRDRNQN